MHAKIITFMFIVLCAPIFTNSVEAVENEEEYGTIAVRSSPSAELYIDDGYVGVTPAHNIKLEVGTHVVRLEKEGYRIWTRTIRVFPGQDVRLEPRLEPIEVESKPLEKEEDREDSSIGLQQGFSVIYENWELDKVRSDSVAYIGGFKLEDRVSHHDIDQERLRLRYRMGVPEAGVGIDFLTGEFGDGDYDLVGVGIVINGEATLEKKEKYDIFISYSLGASYHDGEGDGFIQDNGGINTGYLQKVEGLPVVAQPDADLEYTEVLTSFGFGFDYEGIRPGAGIMANFIDGEADFSSGGLQYKLNFSGENVAGYAGVGYQPKDFPVSAGIQALFGGIKGITASASVRF